MALSEDQIRRYGRQILLGEVGGRGQEKLLSCPVRVLAPGPGIDDAVAWLVAGGTPVELSPGMVLWGFWVGSELEAVSPDATPKRAPVIDLLPWGAASASSAQVVVGAGVAFRTAEACADCWSLTRGLLGADPQGGPVGSLAALAVQRLVLGWAEPLGLVSWTGSQFEPCRLPSCQQHRYTSLQI